MWRNVLLFTMLAGAVFYGGSASATIHHVDIGNFFFSPTKTVVNPGDTVRWTMVGGVHSTTSDGGSSKIWDSGIMSTNGQSFDVVFTAGDGPGPFPYLCSVHPTTMKDTIFMASQGEPTRYVFTLDEAQADGGTGTGSFASGYCFATLSADSSQLEIECYHDLASATLAHIHLGAPGVEGGVQFSLPSASSPIIATWNLDPSDVTNLVNGDLYVNIHSGTFPDGEIRGQIVQSPFIFAFPLTEAEADEGNGTGSSATGFAVCELSTDLTELSIYCEHDVADPIDGHVHLGAPGVGGAVQFGFSSFTSPISETWALTDSDVDNLLAGNLYINIHSNAFPAGEIRGQLDFDPFELNIALDEAQADDCNGSGSAATGAATATLKPGGREMTIAVTHDVSNPIDGHVHLGFQCIGGAIQFGFSSFTSPISEIWYLTNADIINLFQEELYINIHSNAFPSGEIRGQLGEAPTLGCCVGIRGNIDGDLGDNIDISDLVFFVEFSFSAGPEPSCFEEADVNGDAALDIGDIVYMVDYSFGSPQGPEPVACP